MLTEREKDDLGEALNEFARHHDVPMVSPVWASRIGLATAIGSLLVARADIVMNPNGSQDGMPAAPPHAPMAHAPMPMATNGAAPDVASWLAPGGPPN